MPIRDHNPSGNFPAVTVLIIAINVLVFLYEFYLPEQRLENFINTYALVPAAINLSKPATLTPFFTSMFLHGSILHIASNMLFLWVFGDNIEAALGRIKYVLFYLVGGITASLAQLLMMGGGDVPTLGASGAIAAVLGAYLVLYPRARIDVLVPIFYIPAIVAVPAYFMLIYWLVTQLISGTTSVVTQTASTGGVAFFAHIGGFMAGILLINILGTRGRPIANNRWKR